MAVIISNMKFPKRCLDCQLMGREKMYCQLYPRKDLNVIRVVSEKPEWCPLKELSDKPSGEWIWNVDITPSSPVGAEEIDYVGWVCSHCHSCPDDYSEWDDIDEPPTYKYCPNCGSPMDGGKNE